MSVCFDVGNTSFNTRSFLRHETKASTRRAPSTQPKKIKATMCLPCAGSKTNTSPKMFGTNRCISEKKKVSDSWELLAFVDNFVILHEKQESVSSRTNGESVSFVKNCRINEPKCCQSVFGIRRKQETVSCSSGACALETYFMDSTGWIRMISLSLHEKETYCSHGPNSLATPHCRHAPPPASRMTQTKSTLRRP